MKFQFGFLFPLSKNTHPTRDFSRIADKVVLKFLLRCGLGFDLMPDKSKYRGDRRSGHFLACGESKMSCRSDAGQTENEIFSPKDHSNPVFSECKGWRHLIFYLTYSSSYSMPNDERGVKDYFVAFYKILFPMGYK